MSVQVNLHGKKLTAKSRNFTEGNPNPFCTFEVEEDGSSVCVFIHNVEDARLLVEAAVEAHRNAVSIELEKRIDESIKLQEARNELEDEFLGLEKLKALLTEPTVFDALSEI